MAADATEHHHPPGAQQRSLAPIAFFAFRRPWATLQALYSLSRCPEAAASELHVFADGPRSATDAEDVALVREVIRAHPWCGKVELHESTRNRGLSRSVIDGVTALCASHGHAIVLEDDLLVSSGFLDYMNRALDRYRGNPEVLQVSGHGFPVVEPESRAVLLPVTTTWGWATWQRAWAQFEEVPRGVEELQRNARLRRSFDLDGAYGYTALLEAQLAGRIDSWGIRWWWTVHRRGGLGLFPLRSLVRNIGASREATHTRGPSALLESPHWRADGSIASLPGPVAADEELFRRWKEFVRSHRRTSLRERIRSAAAALLSRGAG